MEDTAEEREIRECSSEENNGKVRWVLKKGLVLGKKFLVTGIAISSAPLVVPPLLVISAIGFFCSFPCGLFLASYACTKKVMSKLLPMPEPTPVLLDYGITFDEAEADYENGGENAFCEMHAAVEMEERILRADVGEEIEIEIESCGKGKSGYEEDLGELLDDKEEEASKVKEKFEKMTEQKEEESIIEASKDEPAIREDHEVENERIIGKEDELLKGDNVVKKEEGELSRMIQEADMRVELLEKKNKGFDEENVLEAPYEQLVLQSNENKSVEEIDKVVEKNMCEEDIDKFLNEEEEKPSKETEVEIGEITEGKQKEPMMEEYRGEEPVAEVQGVMIVIEGDEKIDSNVEERTPFEVSNVAAELILDPDTEEGEEIVRETRGLLEKIRDEGRIDHPVGDKQSVEKDHVLGEEGDSKIIGNVEETGIPFEDKCVLGSAEMEKPMIPIALKAEDSSAKRVPEATNEPQGIVPLENVDAARNEMKLTEDAGVPFEKKDIRNILKSSYSVERVVVEEQQEPALDSGTENRVEAKDNVADNVQAKLQLNKGKRTMTSTNEDEHNLYVDDSAFRQQSSHLETDEVSAVYRESDYSQTSLRTETGTTSDKAFSSEENIWEQINALRRIVGYKAAPQGTCMEELKALYLFTGVEPPASFKGPCDLVEVSDKLRFLMSIVGVK